MASRRAVLLTPLSRSVHPTPLPSYNSPAPITHLESTLLQVFILKNLKSFRMNTSKKTGWRGALWLTKIPSRCCLPVQQPPCVSSGSSAPFGINHLQTPHLQPLSFQTVANCPGVYPPPPNLESRLPRYFLASPPLPAQTASHFTLQWRHARASDRPGY